MNRPIALHPKRRSFGTHVLDLGPSHALDRFEVVDGEGKALSRHQKLRSACLRCRWHSGTRFVFVERLGHRSEGSCWDARRDLFVSWTEALRLMEQTDKAQAFATIFRIDGARTLLRR